MDCITCRQHLSDVLDGRLARADEVDLADHLAGCLPCRSYEGALADLHRLVRLRPAEAVPDLSDAILARAHPPRAGRGQWIRLALVAVGLTQLVLALPALVLGDDAGATVHIARHVGSLTVALAIGLIYAAWRPAWAFGLIPIAAALAGCMVVTALLDVAQGHAQTLGEAHHLLDVSGLVLLWLLAGSPLPRRWTGGSGARLPLRAV